MLFKVDGMSCTHCVNAVTGAVQRVDPAASVAVDLQAGQVRVESTAATDRLAAAMAAEGYEATAVPST